MANIKITDLQALNNPKNTDVLPIVDISADETKKVSIADLLENAGEGSVTNASFAFDGDPNTGMYHPSDDVLGFTAGGTQALRIESTGVIVPGNLTVEGTTTTIETTNLVIEDKNIQLATVGTPTNTTADGGGITLKGATDKTITWVNSTGCWTFNQPTNFNDHVRIDSSGNLGVGASSPAAKTHISNSYSAPTGGHDSNLALVVSNSGSANNYAGIGIAAGNNAASFIHFGDTDDDNVGALNYFHDTNSLTLVTSASERLRIDSSGNVGIGGAATSNASTKTLQVTDSTTARVLLESTGTGGRKYGWYASVDGQFAVYDYTASSERLRIDSSGNLGIGTTSAQAKLDVRTGATGFAQFAHASGNGGVRITGEGGSSNANLVFSNNRGVSTSDEYTIQLSGADDALVFRSGGPADTEVMRITSGGSVGIGTSGPGSVLHTEGTRDYTGSTPNIASYDVNFQSGTAYVAIGQSNGCPTIQGHGSGTSYNLALAPNNGNVGIGSTAPRGNLHLHSSSSTRFDLTNTATGTASGDGSTISIDGSTGALNIIQREAQPINFSTSNTSAAVITSSGQMVIGGTSALDSDKQLTLTTTSTSGGLGILSPNNGRGDIFFGDAADDNVGQIKYSHVNDSLTIRTNAADRFTIDSSGRLLIGTSSSNDIFQESQLQIEGSTSATASLSLHQNQSAVDGPQLILGKSRGSGAVGSSDILGDIVFAGNDGTDVNSRGAIIRAKIDGTPGSNDLPTHLAFMTTADGASSPTERMRINSAGLVGINETSPAGSLHVDADSGVDGPVFDSGGSGNANHALLVRDSANSQLLRVNNNGNVGIGTTNPQALFVISNSGAQGIEAGYSSGTSTNFIQAYNRSSSAFIQLDVIGNPLVFKTGSGAAEAARIDSSGNLSAGTGTGTNAITINGSGSSTSVNQLIFYGGGTNNPSAAIEYDGADKGIAFQIGNYSALSSSEVARIDTSGRLLVGTSSTTATARAIFEGNNNSDAGVVRLACANSSPANGEVIGSLVYAGDNHGNVADILVARDGGTWTQGSSQPTRLVFSTTANSASSPTERLRITNDGKIGIGDTDPDALLVIKGNSDAATTPSIRLKDGTDTREAWITNSAGDLSLNVGGNDNVAHGTFKIFDSGILDFAQGASSRVRIDGSGRLLVQSSSAPTQGLYSQYAPLTVKGYIGSTTGNGIVNIARGTTASSLSSGSDIGTVVFSDSAGGEFGRISCFADAAPGSNDYPGRISFHTTADGASSPTERMRIASDGKISIGSTGDPAAVSTDDPKTRLMPGEVSAVNHQSSSLSLNRTGNNGAVAKFFRNGTQVGKITVDTSSTSYVTSSDYRLKENVVELADGITRVKQLAPKRFNFIVDADTTVDGFLAHEAQAVVPEAVTGERDGEEMQGIDQSKLVPLLTAALQEAIAKIETLEQRLTDAGL